MLDWKSFDAEKPPTDGTPVLVWLEKPNLGSRMQAGTYSMTANNTVMGIIGGHFAFDLPRATHWAHQPPGPEGAI